GITRPRAVISKSSERSENCGRQCRREATATVMARTSGQERCPDTRRTSYRRRDSSQRDLRFACPCARLSERRKSRETRPRAIAPSRTQFSLTPLMVGRKCPYWPDSKRATDGVPIGRRRRFPEPISQEVMLCLAKEP